MHPTGMHSCLWLFCRCGAVSAGRGDDDRAAQPRLAPLLHRLLEVPEPGYTTGEDTHTRTHTHAHHTHHTHTIHNCPTLLITAERVNSKHHTHTKKQISLSVKGHLPACRWMYGLHSKQVWTGWGSQVNKVEQIWGVHMCL